MGPTLELSKEIHSMKYRLPGEDFEAFAHRLSDTLKDDAAHKQRLFDIFSNQRFLPGGRVQLATGSGLNVTATNCFVSDTIADSMEGIFDRVKDAALTMKMGGGIGYDFSTIRPEGSEIKSQGSIASGPLSYMEVFDATCKTIASAGHRRGAQMGVLRVDHPDILKFIKYKQNSNKLTAFNISVGITDEFMEAVKEDVNFPLQFNGKITGMTSARWLWDQIMESTWDWAEPGVIFLDTINKMNNLYYCEEIKATNPCAEQCLPPNGACLLGSINLVKYVRWDKTFNTAKFEQDIIDSTKALDNVIDTSRYPLEKQRLEQLNKRRMGIGVTGLANALELMGMPYASPEFLKYTEYLLHTLKVVSYDTSIEVAKLKGSFPLLDKEKYIAGRFIQTLPANLQGKISRFGIRNSHLLSIAPTGTISLSADNVSSGIEPVFSHEYTRQIVNKGTETVKDWAWGNHGLKGRTANEISVDDHLSVLLVSQKHVDSSISKTVNVGENVNFEKFKDVYRKAYEGGAKGVSTFRLTGKRAGILNEVETEGQACFIDPETGKKTCE